jgi:hypothetical protein
MLRRRLVTLNLDLNKSIFERLGILLDETSKTKVNIFDLEKCLIEALYVADNDIRVLTTLLTWGKIHGGQIIIEKFVKIYDEYSKYKGEIFSFNLFVITIAETSNRYFKKLSKIEPLKTPYPDRKSTFSFIKKNGAIEIFEKYNILIPIGYIKFDDADVLTIKQLVEANEQYRNRYLYGANVRADVIFYYDQGIEKAGEIRKEIPFSYNPIKRIIDDYEVSQL